jgi:hypothetical protein
MVERGVVTIIHADVEARRQSRRGSGTRSAHASREQTKQIVREHAGAHGGRQVDAAGGA